MSPLGHHLEHKSHKNDLIFPDGKRLDFTPQRTLNTLQNSVPLYFLNAEGARLIYCTSTQKHSCGKREDTRGKVSVSTPWILQVHMGKNTVVDLSLWILIVKKNASVTVKLRKFRCCAHWHFLPYWTRKDTWNTFGRMERSCQSLSCLALFKINNFKIRNSL